MARLKYSMVKKKFKEGDFIIRYKASKHELAGRVFIVDYVDHNKNNSTINGKAHDIKTLQAWHYTNQYWRKATKQEVRIYLLSNK